MYCGKYPLDFDYQLSVVVKVGKGSTIVQVQKSEHTTSIIEYVCISALEHLLMSFTSQNSTRLFKIYFLEGLKVRTTMDNYLYKHCG